MSDQRTQTSLSPVLHAHNVLGYPAPLNSSVRRISTSSTPNHPQPLFPQYSSSSQLPPMPHPIFPHRPTGIHSLPVELLTRIFILGAGFDYPYADSPFLLKPDEHLYSVPSSHFQVLASHICQQWRQVALRTSALWSILYFREPSHISRAQAFLARCTTSKTCLLDILVDTVAHEDHLPGITLCREEIRQVFRVIVPHVKRWRAFHLKICDNECKGQARLHLGSCGPAPNLETLQLYHFEDYRTSQNLYLATYRPPVVVFSNQLPRLRSVSLIGVNLPWEKSPYLKNLHNLELALHSDNIRPPYEWWDTMLRSSSDLHTLSLHYSGPRIANGQPQYNWPDQKDRLWLEGLRVLSLTDLDPDYLSLIIQQLSFPGISKLSLNLPEQDFTMFVEQLVGPESREETAEELEDTLSDSTISSPLSSQGTAVSLVGSLPLSTPFPNISKLEILVITALECNLQSWRALLRALHGLRVLEIDFARVPSEFWKILAGEDEHKTKGSIIESIEGEELQEVTGDLSTSNCHDAIFCDSEHGRPACKQLGRPGLILPCLRRLKTSGLPGDAILSIIQHRASSAEVGCMIELWMISWSDRVKGVDRTMDELVERGFWQKPSETMDANCGVMKTRFETFDNDEEEEEGDEDNSGEDGEGKDNDDNHEEDEDAGSGGLEDNEQSGEE